jgi:VanZ family protein
MAVIFGLSALPGSAVPGRFGTLGHVALYAVLGGLYFHALPREGERPWLFALAAIACASLYGITDEFHQSFVPGRVPDVVDWLVDTGAAAAAVIVLRALQGYRELRGNRSTHQRAAAPRGERQPRS